MKVLIIGSGPAGVTVAETLRKHSRSMDITMLSSEPYPPYSPPAMLEYYITGRDFHFWKGEDCPQRLGLDYRKGAKVDFVNTEQHTVQLSDNSTIDYGKLVIATGARLYAPFPGADKKNVYNLKSLSSAERLLQQVREGKCRSVLVAGAGFIGTEIAVTLADMGISVTQLVRSRVARTMLDEETSALVLEMIRSRGVNVKLDADIIAFVGEKQAEGVELRSGEIIETELIVAATGLQPNVEFLNGSAIARNDGIIVDDHLRTTAADVYAAGDVAETPDRMTGQRAIYANFPNAIAQGNIVALNILGWDTLYEGSERMNSLKHFDMHVIAVGQMEGEEMRLRHGSILRKLYLKGDRIVGFSLVGDIRAAGIYRTLMNNRINVAPFKHRLLKEAFTMGDVQGLVSNQLLMA